MLYLKDLRDNILSGCLVLAHVFGRSLSGLNAFCRSNFTAIDIS